MLLQRIPCLNIYLNIAHTVSHPLFGITVVVFKEISYTIVVSYDESLLTTNSAHGVSIELNQNQIFPRGLSFIAMQRLQYNVSQI